ncbi:hypothetical protein EMCRGX_G024733 [Ephydatia muelleri]
MAEKNSGEVNEKQLFHGTSNTPPEKVYCSEQGFDFRFAATGMWGTGAYFAVNASYSDSYAYSVTSAQKQMLLAVVLTGDAIESQPDKKLTKPPLKKAVMGSTFKDERYDSVTGTTKGSKIYVVYDHDKAYPCYLITYKLKSTKEDPESKRASEPKRYLYSKRQAKGVISAECYIRIAMAEYLDEDGTAENIRDYDSKQDAIVPKVEPNCPVHCKNRLEVFCNICRVPICHDCALWGKHQGHRFAPLADSAGSWNTVSKKQCGGDIPNDMAAHSTKESMLAYLDGCGTRVTEAIEQVQQMITRVHAQWNNIEEEASQAIHDMFNRLGELAAAELQVLEDSKGRLEAQAEDIMTISEDIKAKSWSVDDKLAQHQMQFQIKPIPIPTSNLASEIIPSYTCVTLKIQNFQELRSCNLKVYSRPLRVDGLVWRLRVYPNGYGEGRGKYLSVFAELTSGNGTTINYQYCIEILHCGRSVHYRQYVSDFSDGGSWGYTKFYLLSKLEEEGIISDDTVVLKFGIRAPTYHLKSCQLAMHNQRLEGQLKSLRRKLRTMQQSLIMHKTEGLLDEEEKHPTITCSKPTPGQQPTLLTSPSPSLPHTTSVLEPLCSANGATNEPRSAAHNQVEIVVTTNKMDTTGTQGNNQPGDQLVRQESMVTRDGTPLSSVASFSWPLSSLRPLRRAKESIADTTIVEIPDCFDLTKPLTGYVPWRGVGSDTRCNISPDCFTTANRNGGSPLHTITGTVWPCGDDVIPVMSSHTEGSGMGDAESISPLCSFQLMHATSPQASMHDLTIPDDHSELKAGRSPTKGLLMGGMGRRPLRVTPDAPPLHPIDPSRIERQFCSTT